MNLSEHISRLKSKFIQNYRGQKFYNFVMSIYDSKTLLSWSFSKEGAQSRKKIHSYKDMYKGERCFILGNGPSLKKTDLKKLKNEYTFGLNRIYLLFDKLNFQTSFLVSTNNLVLEQFGDEIDKLDIDKFISWKCRDFVRSVKNTTFVRTLAKQKFSKNLSNGLWEGATVTFVAMQIAFHMGFEEVILIGVDHSFKRKGRAHKQVSQSNQDVDHFDPNYFPKGSRWHLPDLSTSEYAYSLAKSAFEEENRKILDATINGQLTIFPKVNYDELF